ncbi:hypothetical protein [Olleya marilimosa]|uniref:hypothetical protein n=1 Tax=Olleya marilimosa TaxID=272164 RepID=UPI0004860C83|nr:hypothetical protein [Olleya marilimosa]
MKPILLFLAFFVMTSMSGQVIKNEVSTGQAKHSNLPLVDLNSSLQDNSNAVNYQGYYLSNASLPDVSGSPFPFEDAVIIISTIDGKAYKVPNGNYNASTDEVVSNFAKDSSFVFQSKTIKSVKFEKYTATRYKDINDKDHFYFELTPHASIKLLKKYSAKIIDGQINVLTKQKTSPDMFSLSDSYGITIDGKTVTDFKLNKKSVLKLLASHKKLIQDFVKKENLSYKEEYDIIRILNYYSVISKLN